MPSRLNEFALGATFQRDDNAPPINAVTQTGNNVDSNVEQAVADNGNDTSTAQYVI